MVTLFLGGLWHGAAWTFVAWGTLHGGWLVLERAFGKRSWFRRLPHAVRVGLTFLIVSLAWVFFRAPDLHAAGIYLESLFGLNTPAPGAVLLGGLIRRPYDLLNLDMTDERELLDLAGWDLRPPLASPAAMPRAEL